MKVAYAIAHFFVCIALSLTFLDLFKIAMSGKLVEVGLTFTRQRCFQVPWGQRVGKWKKDNKHVHNLESQNVYRNAKGRHFEPLEMWNVRSGIGSSEICTFQVHQDTGIFSSNSLWSSRLNLFDRFSGVLPNDLTLLLTEGSLFYHQREIMATKRSVSQCKPKK